jgi:hypothetical protein
LAQLQLGCSSAPLFTHLVISTTLEHPRRWDESWRKSTIGSLRRGCCRTTAGVSVTPGQCSILCFLVLERRSDEATKRRQALRTPSGAPPVKSPLRDPSVSGCAHYASVSVLLSSFVRVASGHIPGLLDRTRQAKALIAVRTVCLDGFLASTEH